jgi:AraC-like DNA-binding protein
MPTVHHPQGDGPAWSALADAECSSVPTGMRESTRQARLAIFRAAAEIVASEFAQPLTIEDVAVRVAVSPRQLQRIFTEVRGVGFRTYLAGIRMSRAAELLAQTQLPVKEVAQRVGYRDHSQFSKAFKRLYGVSPSAFRARRRASQRSRRR